MAQQTLFKTVDEINAFIPVNVSTYESSILPFMAQAHKYIKDIIGATSFNDILDYFNSDIDEADEAMDEIIPKIQLPLANFGYMLAIAKLNVNVGENGFTVTSNQNLAPASMDRVREFRDSVTTAGYDALEELIEFVDENESTYPDIYDFIFEKRLFLNCAKDYNIAIFIKIRHIDYIELKKYIFQVEKIIKGCISDELFAEIKAQIAYTALAYPETEGDVLSEANQTLLDNYIKPAVAYLSLNLWKPDPNFKDEGTKYIEELVNYLNENASTYPLFEATQYNSEGRFENDADSGFFVSGGGQ
jgi:hypothetical protein